MRNINAVIILFLTAVVLNCLRQLLDWSVSSTQNILGLLAAIFIFAAAITLFSTEWRDRRPASQKRESGR
ncbi:hypothetical protein WB91_22135 [bacteria symbiont BFo1 of Frankliniella occidentalis]|jgi:ABC-type nickel/cobalt efflux system permease component RcnA|uniref:hypothetical protein n=1 Tax=Erwinia aphidicola TaxID=68334 RepID=UPI000789FC63|nr:hypothetical protein WB91_22135 [bacteria symbiont BFo1 of Frankliniella occidentalis]